MNAIPKPYQLFPEISHEMKVLIEARVEAIRQAYASNLIEGLDAGLANIEAMIERAHEPISNEEFSKKETARIVQKYARA